MRNDIDNALQVNFSPALVRLLREVKYFKQLEVEVIPQALDIYAKDDVYRVQVNKIDWIVQMYNIVKTTLHPVEEPLVITGIETMDSPLEPGISKYVWEGDNTNEFIRKSHDAVEKVYKIVNKMKDDLSKIRECLSGMNKPLIERKPKPTQPDEFLNIHQASINASHQRIRQDGNVITKLIKEINDAVKIDKKSKPWKDYQEFINDIVIEGISISICTSLQTLNEFIEMKPHKKDPSFVPLFDIKIELAKNKIQFDPEIQDHPNGITVRAIINSIISDFLALGILIQRIDTGNVGDYLTELKDNFEIRDCLAEINQNLDTLEQECDKYRESFNHLEKFWTQDPKMMFEKFLEDEKEPLQVVTGEDGNEADEEGDEGNPLMAGVITRLPKFELFDQKILELKEIKSKMQHIKNSHDIGW